MVAPNPLAARRRTNWSSFSVAVPSSWDESVFSGAITNRFPISRPLLNRKGDQTTIDQTSDIPQAKRHRLKTLGCNSICIRIPNQILDNHRGLKVAASADQVSVPERLEIGDLNPDQRIAPCQLFTS